MKVPTYLDANSGAPLSAGAQAAIFSVLDGRPGNASSVHGYGRRAKRFLAEAREAIAAALGDFDPEQLVLASSGSEANQTVIRSVLGAALSRWEGAGRAPSERPNWVLSPVEHDSVRQLQPWFEARGGECRLLPLLPSGEVDLGKETLTRIIDERTGLATLIWVGNETGILHSPGKLTSHIHKRGLPARTLIDGAQAWGKVPIDLTALRADYVTFSGHKIGGPAGVGVLALRAGAPFEPWLPGKQEKGRRGGSENLLGIVGLGGAARDLAVSTLPGPERRDRFEAQVRERVPGTRIHGEGAPRVWNTSNLGFAEVEGDSLVMALDLEGFAVSAGSACSSGAIEPSHVLLAMGYSRAQAMSAIRVSFGRDTSESELESLVEALALVVARARSAR
jgi:cysteine desulfurase